MKHEILQPVRHYSLHEDPLNNIETIHLVLWSKGLCIAGFSAEAKLLVAKIYTALEWDASVISSIFINEPLVAGPQHITHIWVAEERIMLVPHHLYEATAAKEWLKKFHFVEEGETILNAKIAAPVNAFAVFPMQNKWIDMCYKFFAEGKISSLSGMLLCQSINQEKDTLDITILDHTALLSVYKSGKLLSHQVMENVDINNMIYRVGSICQENDIRQESLSVRLSGLCISNDMCIELLSYFPKMELGETEKETSFTFLRKLIACV